MAAPTGTRAHGPGNSLTPSISAPHERMARIPMVASSVRSHIGQVTNGTNAPIRTPSSSSHARATLL